MDNINTILKINETLIPLRDQTSGKTDKEKQVNCKLAMSNKTRAVSLQTAKSKKGILQRTLLT